MSRRNAIRQITGATLYAASFPMLKTSEIKGNLESSDPTNCNYAPPGEYIKDHTFVFHDGWWHLFSISGTQGYYHGYNGNEETFSWSISKNLVDWEFRGHVIHPSLRKGTFDQHEVWAPYCLKANGKFYMFYTGIIHPHRPLEYHKLGFKHPWVSKGHKETQGLAVSEDLTDWVKVTDPENGLGIPGRDSNVIWDEVSNNWLLYSTGQGAEIDGKSFDTVLVSKSKDLINWKHVGVCALFPKLDQNKNYGFTVENWPGLKTWTGTTESMVTMKHPLTGKWIMMGNWQYVISDDPLNFKKSEVRYYNNTIDGKVIDLGFACEILQFNGKWYRSGTFGKTDYWKLGFTEIEWDKNGAFKIVKPSSVTN
jgi:hypothetical protein